MPLPTSDFRNPVCLEMKNLRLSAAAAENGVGDLLLTPPTASIVTGAPFMVFREPLQSPATAASAEVGSMDSSDTYASCNTHPFYSQVPAACFLLPKATGNLFPKDTNQQLKTSVQEQDSTNFNIFSGIEKDISRFCSKVNTGTAPSL